MFKYYVHINIRPLPPPHPTPSPAPAPFGGRGEGVGWGGGEGAYVYTSAYMFRNINREVEGFSIITRSLTMEIERNLVQMIRTGPPEVLGRFGQVLGRFG